MHAGWFRYYEYRYLNAVWMLIKDPKAGPDPDSSAA